MKEEQTYNSAIAEIEAILNDLESAELDIDTLSEKVKRAAGLIGFCREKLVRIDSETQKILDGI